MSPTFQLGGRRFDVLDDLLAALPDATFASARRSTLPLIDYWRDPAPRLDELRRLTAVEIAAPVELYFEYPVLPRQGQGKASFTDLMIMAPNAAIAVEAKFTEPAYELVSKWLGDSSPNRVAVLNGWLDCINQAASLKLTIPDIESVPYQLIHRTASVCSLPVRSRAVVYQTFGDPPLNHYAEAISRLSDLGVTGPIKILAMNVTTRPTAELIEIERSLSKGSAELIAQLRRTLAERPLFHFDS